MAIEKKLVCFKTQANFDAQLAAGNIREHSIVFIKDTQKIWTHGVYFTSLKKIFEKFDEKQDVLTAGDNITITDYDDDRLHISAKDTTYTLQLVGDSLKFTDSDENVVATIDLSKYKYTLPIASSDNYGGVKLFENNNIHSAYIRHNHTDYQTLPNNGKKNQILACNGGNAVWVDFGLLDSITYGVSWDFNTKDPHLKRIGNMNFHKTLPIQSAMRGCIYNPKIKQVIYWLDKNDWRFRREPIMHTVSFRDYVVVTGLTTEIIRTLAVGQYVRVNTIKGKITEIRETEIQIQWEGGHDEVQTALNNTTEIEIGSRLDGYDGEVMVYVPEFWIKSWFNYTDNIYTVRISLTKIDNYWEHQPAVYIAAYRDTVLNTVPQNMGYLSTLEVDTAVSIANSAPYCRGGSNRANTDKAASIFARDLGKCRTNVTRDNFRQYVRKAGKEIMSYHQYKNIIYWLWVIEYANFNVQDTYNPTLTIEEFHQGGLGQGLTNVNNWQGYNEANPIVPNGYTNEFGNNTSIKLVAPGGPAPVGQIYSTRWRGLEDIFGHIWHNVDGIRIYYDSYEMHRVAITNDREKYTDPLIEGWIRNITIPSTEGYTRRFSMGDRAHIFPTEVNGSNTWNMCDYYWPRYTTTSEHRIALFGGAASGKVSAGIATLDCYNLLNHKEGKVGFRSVVQP